MSDLSFEVYSSLSKVINHSHTLNLWIWHADKMPPHIGCSAYGMYFSLKVNGKDNNIKHEKVAALIDSKKIPFLLIETNIALKENDLFDVFSKYQNAGFNNSTCLSPVLEVIGFPDAVNQLKDLIEFLERTDRIKHIFGIHLDEDFKGISDYGPEEIRERICKLRNAKRKENIS